jgi:hypothetical protein
MNRLVTAGIVLFVSSGGTFVAAQTGSPSKPPSASAPSPGTKDAPATKEQGLNQGPTNNGMMGPGMMGMTGMCPGMAAGTQGTGMMGGGMMGTCPGVSARDTKMHVTKQPKGASMVITSEDPQIVACLQSAADGSGGCMMGGRGAQGHMMGPGMMGSGGTSGAVPPAAANGAGTCSGMMGPGTNVQVAKVTKGVSFTMTGTDSKAVTRIQKMAEAMRLMHEAMGQ